MGTQDWRQSGRWYNMEEIDWSAFASPYWRPTTGEQHRLVLAYWRQETRSYDDDKTEKPVLVFDVLKVDGEEFAQGQRIFVTGASSFAEAIRPVITKAELRKEKAVNVIIRYDKDKKYTVIDLFEEPRVKKEYMGLKE